MASSASSAEPPPQHRSHRWTVVFTFASFLALLLLLQSEGLATRFTAVQDVVTKNVSLRGVGTYPGVEITADSNGELETEAVDEAVAATKAEEEAAAKKAADEAAAEAKKVEEEAAAKKAAEEVATAAKKAEEEAAAKKAADEAAAIAEKAEEEAAVKKAEEEVAAKKAAEEAAVAAKQAEEEAASKKVADEAAAAEAPAKEDKPLPSARDDREGVPNDCPTKCSARVEQHKHRWGGDLSNTADVKRLVTQARNKLVARLKVDYGEENFGKIFEVNGESRGRRAFSSANETQAISTKRFKRKLKMKILAVQKAIQEEEDNVGGCDCRGETKAISLRYLADETMSTGEALPDHYTRMVWATGGHSSAAGHGNLFNESYTAFLEKAVTDVFGSIGIDFEGRNYAMGGTSSGAEVALCSEAIFGTDPDVISWDYGMTDGRWFFRQGMYNNRIGINPNRPAIVGISVGGREQSSRLDQLQRVEDRGLTALLLNPDEFDAMIDAIPDTFGLTTEQINAMPKMVQHFRCGDAVEKGEPTCDANKYDTAMICPDRRYTAPWHPGWKWMALTGNIMALFLADMLIDTIEELGSTTSKPSELLNQLRTEEDADYEMFFQSALPDDSVSFTEPPYLTEDFANEVNVSHFFRSPSICRTGRLPSQSRYMGIMTESNQIGVNDYYKGIPRKEADEKLLAESVGNATMPLVYEEYARQQCEVELNMDYKDFFYTTNRQGWSTLTIPNESEKRAYGRESEKLLGIIIICLVVCDFGKCPEGDIQHEAMMNGTVQVEVNGRPATNFTKFDMCEVVRGDDGYYWKANDAGQYVVGVRVVDESDSLSFFRISSLLVL